MKCCLCKENIDKGDKIFWLNSKYKIAGEQICEYCADREAYRKNITGVR